MTEILNAAVSHKKYGNGKITKLEKGFVTILFNDFEKKFTYPDSFKNFLSISEPDLSEKIRIVIEEIEFQKQELKRIEEEKRIEALRLKEIQDQIERDEEIARKKLKKKKPGKKIDGPQSIAFKLNYCDGGQSHEQIGFNGICSDEIIQYNIEEMHRSWCGHKNSDCYQYLYGSTIRKELDDLMDNGEDYFVCYESQVLSSWKAIAGEDDDGSKRPIRNAKTNGLGILTTRLPSSEEKDRVIFGVFLVDDVFEGDADESGYVAAKSEFKIKLTREEALKMKFWNYYANQNDGAKWGTGLFRYLNDDQSVQILKDLVKIKENTKEDQLTKDFLDYYYEKNHIEIKQPE